MGIRSSTVEDSGTPVAGSFHCLSSVIARTERDIVYSSENLIDVQIGTVARFAHFGERCSFEKC
jgi:hypothetical protein